jgi:hypothetical protein
MLSFAVASCSHGALKELPTGPSPTAPGPTTVTIGNLTIMPPGGGTLIVGNSAPITSSGTELGIGAWAQYTDGSARFVEAQWTSSDTKVITIDGNSMRAVGRGTAVLTARAEGKTATETFRVEPDMAGTWSGTYIVEQCAAGSGSMGEIMCNVDPSHQRGLLAVGTSAPITMVIRKSGVDLTADVAFGDWRGTLRGSDRGSNAMTLSGELTGNRARITIVLWDSRVKTDVMEGLIAFEVRIDTVPSNAAIVARFENVTRR